MSLEKKVNVGQCTPKKFRPCGMNAPNRLLFYSNYTDDSIGVAASPMLGPTRLV